LERLIAQRARGTRGSASPSWRARGYETRDLRQSPHIVELELFHRHAHPELHLQGAQQHNQSPAVEQSALEQVTSEDGSSTCSCSTNSRAMRASSSLSPSVFIFSELLAQPAPVNLPLALRGNR